MIFQKDLNRREKILVLILALLFVFYAYYFLVQRPVSSQMAALETEITATETEITALQTLLQRQNQMESELATSKEAPIPDFDNLRSTMAFLHSILPATTEYEFVYDTPVPVTEGSNILMRVMKLDFQVRTYQELRTIIDQLEDCPDRCLLNDLNAHSHRDEKTPIAPKAPAHLDVTLTVTFFEHLEPAASLASPEDAEKVGISLSDLGLPDIALDLDLE